MSDSGPASPPLPSAPRTVVVIDVGSTAIRMEIAELSQEHGVRTLETLRQPTHLGKDTFTMGRIQQTTIEECVHTLKGYRRVMEEDGVTEEEQTRGRSGTRKEELLTQPDELQKMWVLRKVLNPLSPVEAMELLIDKLSKTKSNGQFLANMSSL